MPTICATDLHDKLQALMVHPDLCGRVRDFIAHFASPVRMKVLCRLTGGPACVGDIVESVGEKQSTVSQQLKHLLLAGLVQRHREGTRIIYEIADPLVLHTMSFLSVVGRTLSERD